MKITYLFQSSAEVHINASMQLVRLKLSFDVLAASFTSNQTNVGLCPRFGFF